MPRFLRRKDIDDRRWDEAVDRDPSGLPYGFTWWLDAVTDRRWGGVILDDYRAVLPLPYARKLGRFTQVQRGNFTQQGGPWGTWSGPDVTDLLSDLPGGILKLDLPLSARVTEAVIPPGYTIRYRTNYVLGLDRPREEITRNFHRALRRKLKRFPAPGHLRPASAEEIIGLYRPVAGVKAGLKELHYARVKALMQAANLHGTGRQLALEDDGGQLLAAGFFPTHKGRCLNLFGASSEAGYAKEGMTRLLLALLDYEPADKLLDFEGSDLPGVATFFRSFGPVEEGYLQIGRSAV